MRATRSLVAVCTGGLLLLTACGGSDSGSSATPESKPPATSASPSPTAPKASELAEDARKAFLAAPMARLKGTATQEGETLTLDVTTDAKGNGTGAVSMGAGEGTATIILLGKDVFVSGDPTFWTKNAGPEAAKMFKGKWIASSSTASDFAELTELLDRSKLTDGMFDDVLGGKVEAGADGKTWSLTDSSGTLVVDKASGRPLSLKGEDADGGGEFAFTYPAGAITAPPTAQIVKIP